MFFVKRLDITRYKSPYFTPCLSSPPTGQIDHVQPKVTGDPARANVYLWHPEGPPGPPGEGAVP